MNEIAQLNSTKSYTLKTSQLLLIAFATAFFPRILDYAGAPSVINYVHLLIVPFACVFALAVSKPQSKQQVLITKELLLGLVSLLVVTLISAIYNGTGVINVVLDFLLLAEPFIFLLAWQVVPFSKKSLEFVLNWFIAFNLFHLGLALLHGVTVGTSDHMQGVFYFSNSGHVVASSVIVSFGLFYLFSKRKTSVWLRGIILTLSFTHLVLADAKQVMLTLIVGFMLLSLFNLKDLGKAIFLMILGTTFAYLFYRAIYIFPALSSFRTWIRPELYTLDGEATRLKTGGIRVILEHYESFLHWLFGLGPGHTIDRLGFTVLREHGHFLNPLGATVSPVGSEVLALRGASWLGDQSSFFSPFWGWAAIWGDLGVLGLLSYFYICYVVWQRLCLDDFSKFILLTVAVHGFIFTQLEEPGYMLTIATIVGLNWHKNK